VHFVPGFSKKSTVFNRPVLITSNTARKTYFGDIDRTLEKKGSFFHRTIDIALQTAPVYAMNLLKTNSNDTLDYASISLSAQFDNDIIQTEQYDEQGDLHLSVCIAPQKLHQLIKQAHLPLDEILGNQAALFYRPLEEFEK
jgi:hypothetical protein